MGTINEMTVYYYERIEGQRAVSVRVVNRLGSMRQITVVDVTIRKFSASSIERITFYDMSSCIVPCNN